MRLAPVLAAAIAAAAVPRPAAAWESLEVPGFGAVPVLRPPAAPARAVLLLPDARATGPAVAAIAARLAAGGALVALVDVPRRLAADARRPCAYPAGALEELAQGVQKRAGLPEYLRPILVGDGTGAAVAYASVAQAPAGTFRGAVAAALCPARPLPVHLCRGGGPPPEREASGDRIGAGPLKAPLAVLSGDSEDACAGPAEAFARRIPGASFARVAGAGRDLSAAAWAPAIAAAVSRVEARAEPAAGPARPPEVTDLPVVEAPAPGQGKLLAVMVTGDGGWVGLDKGVAKGLNTAGVSVVGLDSLRYFWAKRTPAETARDVARLVEHYRASWSRPDAILVGYSRGADVLPFVAALLPAEARARLRLVALLGPSTWAEFEVHVVDLFSSVRRSDATSTERAVRATGGYVPFLCVHGTEEHDSLCPRLADLSWVKDAPLAGGHHFGGDYDALARLILDAAAARP